MCRGTALPAFELNPKTPLLHSLSKHSKVIDLLILVSIVLLGILLITQVTLYSTNNARDHFVAKATLLAQALNPDDIAKLQGNSVDTSTPEYQRTVQRMRAVAQALPDIRFAYLMRQVNGQIIFISDSEPVDSVHASSYGEVYTESTDDFRQIFVDGEPLFEGPIHDRWGNWVSAHASIRDASGNVVAIVGLDIDASDWLIQMRWYQAIALLLTFLLLALFCLSVVFYLAMRRWREAEAENRYRAIHDSLTGLHNRFFMQEALYQAIRQHQQKQRCFAVLFIDLNGLKRINDHFGHGAGDALIIESANRIHDYLFKIAAVGRLGGDEFLAILHDIDDAAQAHIVATHLKHAVLQPLESELVRGFSISCSVGIAMFPTDGDTADALLSHADTDMYQNKRAARHDN